MEILPVIQVIDNTNSNPFTHNRTLYEKIGLFN